MYYLIGALGVVAFFGVSILAYEIGYIDGKNKMREELIYRIEKRIKPKYNVNKTNGAWRIDVED